MKEIQLKDQIGNQIFLANPAQRIISLVPSQTELLYDLGLSPKVVGITKFCVHPADWKKEKSIVGGTKNHHLDKIHDLNPDLIIANKEENTKQLIEKLQSKYPVYVSDISNLEEAYQMMKDVAELTGTQDQAKNIIDSIKQGFQGLSRTQKDLPSLNIAYCIWRDPWMWAGSDTFIDHLLRQCSFRNVIDENRYPEIALASIQQLAPDFIFLSSEPYPFKQKHIDEIKELFPKTHIMLVDGEYFSWYGSRLVKSPLYFTSLLKQVHSYTL